MGHSLGAGLVVRIDPASNEVVETIPVDAGSGPGGIGCLAVGAGGVWVTRARRCPKQSQPGRTQGLASAILARMLGAKDKRTECDECSRDKKRDVLPQPKTRNIVSPGPSETHDHHGEGPVHDRRGLPEDRRC